MLKVNGRRVGDDMMQPAFTAYDKTVLYNIYNISRYLDEGTNEMEVTLGNGWYNEMQPSAWQFEHAAWRAQPKMTAEVYIDEELFIVSDSSWECARSGIIFNSLRCGETFDGGYQIDGWRQASIAPAPGGVMKEQRIPPVRVRSLIEPVAVIPGPLPVIYDFGVNLSGNVEIKVTGKKGSKATIQYFELLRTTRTPDLERYKQHVYDDRFQRDEYILSGQGIEIWHSEFSYNGFRYARVYGEYETIEVVARCFHTDLPDAGGLRCDNPHITKIHEAVRRSTLTNFHHIPTDCPHREKNGWTGDAHLSCEQALFNFDMKQAYVKWMDDIADCQRPNGRIPCIAPTSSWGYDHMLCGPAWDAVLFVIPWQLYRYTGRTEYIQMYYEPMERYIGYLQSILDHGICRIGLGDWSVPVDAPECPTASLLTAYSFYIADLFGRISGVLHKEENRRQACRLADEIKASFLREYGKLQTDSQLFYAMMLYFGLAEDVSQPLDHLIRTVEKADYHIMGGIFCSKMLLDALTDNGHFDVAYKIASQRDFPGWGYMTDLCAGTLGENWYGGSSMNHHMFSEIGAWYYKALAGFNIDDCSPGFKHIRLTPHIPRDVHEFCAWHHTPYGRLEISWDKEHIRLILPEGVAATLVYEGITQELASGEYSFNKCARRA
ncbi:MAG: alpha-rhamnosidase [Paenibacillaceae bacterium]|nr:alpha-rhamnosidase [Paenibacillaceae bacterium]